VPVQQGNELLGRRELVDRDRHHVVADVVDGGFIKVIANPGPMRQQVLDRHVVGDQGQVFTEPRAGRRAELERSTLHETHHRQCGQALRSTRGREQRLDRVGDAVRSIGEPIRLAQLDVARAVDADHPGESAALGFSVDRVLK
jgi:hypothetical protein